ncbi:MAG: VOC family protein [Peptostreptococcaceae bacterium]|nr:VOC family protein [Peptostreptococcaceae bacterium]
MKNLWTTIAVSNMEDSLNFYTTVLDLEIANMMKPNEDIEIVFLCKGETKLELIHNKHVKEITYSGNVSTGFSIDSVDDYIEYLKTKNINIIEGPFQPNPHTKFFFINDPNGYKIQLVEQS